MHQHGTGKYSIIVSSSFFAKLFSLPAGIRNCNYKYNLYRAIVQSSNIWFLFQKVELTESADTAPLWQNGIINLPNKNKKTNLKFILPRPVLQLHSFIASPCPFISASVLTKAGVAGVCLEGCFRCCIQNMNFQLGKSRISSCFVH